jgi:hypothetical protein
MKNEINDYLIFLILNGFVLTIPLLMLLKQRNQTDRDIGRI